MLFGNFTNVVDVKSEAPENRPHMVLATPLHGLQASANQWTQDALKNLRYLSGYAERKNPQPYPVEIGRQLHTYNQLLKNKAYTVCRWTCTALSVILAVATLLAFPREKTDSLVASVVLLTLSALAAMLSTSVAESQQRRIRRAEDGKKELRHTIAANYQELGENLVTRYALTTKGGALPRKELQDISKALLGLEYDAAGELTPIFGAQNNLNWIKRSLLDAQVYDLHLDETLAQKEGILQRLTRNCGVSTAGELQTAEETRENQVTSILRPLRDAALLILDLSNPGLAEPAAIPKPFNSMQVFYDRELRQLSPVNSPVIPPQPEPLVANTGSGQIPEPAPSHSPTPSPTTGQTGLLPVIVTAAAAPQARLKKPRKLQSRPPTVITSPNGDISINISIS